jgi:hypothetical protein
MLNSEPNFDRFRNLARPPFVTNELTEGIFNSFEKVFESQNGFEKFDFSSPELEEDFADYRKRIGDFNFWETQGMETFKNSIDNILVVDLPRLETDELGQVKPMAGDRPEPYYYLLDINRLHDYDATRVIGSDEFLGTGAHKEFYYFKAEYIIFKETAENVDEYYVYVYDDASYRVFLQRKNGDPILVSESLHELGFCPARSFWTTPLNSNSKLLKRGPITNSLSDLEWLLFFHICEHYAQLYLSFPIVAMYRNKCSYKETAEGSQKRSCVGGFLEVPGSRVIGVREPCPRCSNAGKVGPGHIIYIDPPKDGDDINLMSEPIKVIPTDTESLEYVQKRIREMKQEIRVACVGRSMDTNDASAKNELQVESGFESSEAILLKIKRNFEIVHEFALDTVARLRYGAEYLGGVVNYGDEFLQKTEGQEMEEYKTAVENKLPSHELHERRKDIYKARYRNDPKRQERLRILENLEPFPDLTPEQLLGLHKLNAGMIQEEDVILKMNFVTFINRFERERAPIVLFGSAIDFKRRIDLIREDLLMYVAEYKTKLVLPPTPPPGAPPGGPPIPPSPPKPEPQPEPAGA